MARYVVKWLLVVIICAAFAGCVTQDPKDVYIPENADVYTAYDTASAEEPMETHIPPESGAYESLPSENTDSEAFSQTGSQGVYDYVEQVDNFLVIMDASGSKYLPYRGETKLKICKDIVRRFNERVPSRPLTGGLRRYGFEAGAFSEKTELIYGMTAYNRQNFRQAIETVRWAAGKSPLAMVIRAANEDMSSLVGNMALVIVSDGNIYEGDPLQAAREMKERYGDRLCIYTALVGQEFLIKTRKITNKELLEEVAKIGGCGYPVSADFLKGDANLDQWVDDIFNRRQRRIEKCPDADGDGVCDDQDRCPGTPRGAIVDEYGCWILDRVQFDLDKYVVKPEFFPVIDEVGRVMNLNPGLKMRLEGHTCIIASEKYNMKLSHNRALAVMDYLMKHGISSDRISVEGFAYHRPIAPNNTNEGRMLNRRTEFVPIR